MRRFETDMDRIADDTRFIPCVCTPQQKYDRRLFLIESRNYGVGHSLPAAIFMTVRDMFAHGQYRIQQQHALLSPTGQIAGRRFGNADIMWRFPKSA